MSDKTLVESLVAVTKAWMTHDADSFQVAVCARNALPELARLQAKCNNSLANNLCPDHRDKQAGKPCLACEIERLTELNALHEQNIALLNGIVVDERSNATRLQAALSQAESERDQARAEVERLTLENEQYDAAVKGWMGSHCGGDCLAKPCAACDGTQHISGDRDVLIEERDHLRAGRDALKEALRELAAVMEIFGTIPCLEASKVEAARAEFWRRIAPALERARSLLSPTGRPEDKT